MASYNLSRKEITRFHEDGFVIVKALFSKEEMDLLLQKSRHDVYLKENATDLIDRHGRVSKVTLWNHPGSGLYGAFSRCARLVDNVESLLGGEVYHWHSKMMLKEPKVGGAWEWHQDYGYWYNHGCITPDLTSCMIAVDKATKANGCLQVLKGAHKAGRIEHGVAGDQVGADIARVEAMMERYEHVYVELEAGDTLFFHSNLLHTSEANTSDDSRWCLICCYNKRDNSPFKEDCGHPHYTPLEKVHDDDVLRIGREELEVST